MKLEFHNQNKKLIQKKLKSKIQKQVVGIYIIFIKEVIYMPTISIEIITGYS